MSPLCSYFYNKLYLLRVIAHVCKRPTDFSPTLLPLNHSTQPTPVSLLVLEQSKCTPASRPLHLLLHVPGSLFPALSPGFAPQFLLKAASDMLYKEEQLLIPRTLFLYPVYYFQQCLSPDVQKGGYLTKYHLEWNNDTDRGSIHNSAEVPKIAFVKVFRVLVQDKLYKDQS